MKILDIFTKKNKIAELNNKITDLESTVKKSLQTSLAVGDQYQGWNMNSNKTQNPFDKHYTIFRGVQMSANNISSLPIDIYRGETNLSEDFILPNGFNIYQPNPRQAFSELLYQGLVYFFYRGEMFIYIKPRDELNPFFSLEVLNPSQMVKQKDGTWKYDSKLIISNEELIYTKIFNPDGDRGLSPFDVIKRGLNSDLSAEEYNIKFFENFAQIGGTLIDKDGTASDDEMRKVTREVNTLHASSQNAHKIMGLPQGIEYKESTQNKKDMEFSVGRKDFRDESLASQGIHKALLGVTDSMNRNTNEEAYRQLWKITLKPVALQSEAKINQHLFKRYFPGYRMKFDFSDVDALKENEEVKIKNAESYRKLGYSINEINKHFKLGMEEIKEPIGDMRFVPTNFVPVDDYYIDDNKSIPEKTYVDKISKIFEEDEVKTKSISNKSKTSRNYVRNHNKLQRTVEKKIHGKIGKYFATQLGKVLKLVNTEGMDSANVLLLVIHNLINKEKTVLMDTMRPVYQDGSSQAVSFARTSINAKKAVYTTDYAQEVVESMINKISNINNYTYKLIRDEVKDSIAGGETLQQLSKKLTRIYKFNSSRSRTIARTESAAVISRSTDKVYRDNDVKKKEWIGGERATHADNESEGVVLYDHVYSNGQQFPSDGGGGASENINCKCTFAPVI